MNDNYDRKIDYFRISVTDRCNLRCSYCMPPEGIKLADHDDILRYEEIIRLSQIAYELGFRKFRITGGEPLCRKGISHLISGIAKINTDIELSLTTNGVLLGKYADELKTAGLPRVNISLDTLNREKFRTITRFDLFNEVIDGIKKAIEVGFSPVKINVVVVRGVNDDEILDFVEFVKDKPLFIRFIELMPFRRNGWSEQKFISSTEIRQIIDRHYNLSNIESSSSSGPSVDYNIDGYKGKIGFISPLTERFCSSCNRLRLTADGHLLPCLMSSIEIDIKKSMRSGATDRELMTIMQNAILKKPEGHKFSKTCSLRDMSRIGG